MPSTAAGLIVYRENGNKQFQFLLLQASYPPYHWSPPKGHVDPGEDDLTAAIRETEEEAHVKKEQMTIHEECSDMISYEIKEAAKHPEDVGKVKTVKYWLARLNNADEVKLSDEHNNWKWEGIEEVVKICNFGGIDRVFKKFNDFLLKQ